MKKENIDLIMYGKPSIEPASAASPHPTSTHSGSEELEDAIKSLIHQLRELGPLSSA